MSDSKRVPQIAANASAPEPKLKVDYVSPDLLRPSPRNARLHSRKKIRQLSQSIKALKVIAPILVDEDFEILAGHARWAAAKLLGLSEIPVVQIRHLAEAEKRAYRLADNRFSEKATWDNELPSIEIKELIATEIEIELTGFDTADIDIILTNFDDHEAEAPRARTSSSTSSSAFNSILQNGHQTPQYKLMTRGPFSNSSVEEIRVPSWSGRAKVGAISRLQRALRGA